MSRTALRVATYNVHRCVGVDGRRDAGRVGAVLSEVGADVVGLQEVDCCFGAPARVDQLLGVAAEADYDTVLGPALVDEAGCYGNALLTRLPVQDVRRHDLSVRGREPRAALDVVLDWEGRPLRVVVVHLGLSRPERGRQVERLLEVLRSERSRPRVLLGDVNEWNPLSGRLSLLDRALGRSRVIRTFPARFPLLALDRVWVEPRAWLTSAQAHRSRVARVASDHLPVWASLRVPSSEAARQGPRARRPARMIEVP